MEHFGEVRLKGDGIAVFPAVTRYTVVDYRNNVVERYGAFDGGVEVHIQDGGRTIKVFPLRSEGFE